MWTSRPSPASGGLRYRLAIVLGLCISFACGAESRKPPQLLAVVPHQVSRLLEARVLLEGEHFRPYARVSLSGDAPPRVDPVFQVLLGETPLPPERVTWIDATRIEISIAAAYPLGTYDVTVIAPDGRRAALVDGLEVSDEPYGLRVSIENARGGAGQPVPPQTFVAGSDLSLFAVLRGGDEQFAGDVAVSWRSLVDLGPLDPGPAASSMVSLRRAGDTQIAAEHPIALDALTGTLTVVAGPAVALSLEDAPGGSGNPVVDSTLTTDERLSLFAIARDAFGNFVEDASGSFSFAGSLVDVAQVDGSSVQRELSLPGAASVRFDHPTLGSVSLTLEIDPGRAAQLAIEPDAVRLSADDAALDFGVAALDADGNATEDWGELTWSIAEGAISSIDPNTGRFDPTAAGRGRVRVDSSHGAFDETGDVDVIPGQVATLAVQLPAPPLSADDPAVVISAVARDADGNLTTDVGTLTWSVASGGISSIDPVSGLFDPTIAGVGRLGVESSLGAVGQSAPLTVVAGRAVSLDVAPSTLTLSADDAAVDFSAAGVDADGNLTADLGTLSWSIASGPIGSLNAATGRFDPTTAGSGVVSVQSSHGPSDSAAPVVVTAGRAASFSITPPTATLSADDAPVDFAAAALDADGNATTDLGTLTWSVASGPIGSLNAATGHFDPTTAGTGRLQAVSSHGASAQTGDVVVTPGRVAQLGISPNALSVSADAAARDFVASGVDADGNATSDLGTLSWSIESGGIGNLNATTGHFDPVVAGSGSLRVQSSHGPFRVSGSVVVTPGRAVLLDVTPDTATTYVPGGPSLAFSASGRDADGNVTGDLGTLSWSIASGALSSLNAQSGLLTPTSEGLGRVRATSSYGLFDDSGSIEIAGAVAPLGVDPLGDGSSFAQVVAFDGQVFLGPSAEGGHVARSSGDGSPFETAPLSFESMDGLDNDASPPFASIGFSGCNSNTLECGPDNENGRGEFGAGTLAGSEWLALSGARSSGDLEFVYLAPAGVYPPEFRPVDIKDALGPQTRGTSAMHFFGDRLYLGFPDTGGSRPYFVTLVSAPPSGGLDASEGSDVINLEGRDMPDLVLPNHAMIDVIADFANRLYLANAGGWMRSTVERPRPYDNFPEDWAITTPSASAYSARTSVTTTKTADLLPSDRAVPAMAEFAGWFYAARNTTSGPQLWGCNPAVSGGADCEPGDWRLCAVNTSGDLQLSQFNDADNAFVSLLAATDTALYVGFDNATDGVVAFRSTVPGACLASDFEGDLGCSAADAPGACSGVGGNGLGQGLTQFFSARSAPLGADVALFVTAGNGSGPVHAYRFLP